MSNRFHSKYHRQNHHTYVNPYNADAGHDPIASREQPFKGDFVLAGALSCFAPNSATAGFFYSNNTALCAFAGKKGAHIFSNGDSNNTGIYVYSSGIALSALAAVVGINVYSLQYGIDVYGFNSSIRSYSPNYGINSYGGIYGGNFGSAVMGISAFGGIYGAQVTSPQFGLNVWGGTYGGNFYSNNRGISAYGANIGIEVYSPIRGINVRALSAAIVANSPTIALSSGGGGVNIFNNRVGIFKEPASAFVFDVRGNSYMDGNLTVTGDISAYGVYSYFDTRVTITSSFKVFNRGTDSAVEIQQTGNYPILACYDADISNSIPSFLVDGATSGWVSLGASTPKSPFFISKNKSQSNNQPQIVVTDDVADNPKRIAFGVETDRYTNPFLGTESPHHLLFNTNSATRMILTSSGEFIIGDYIGSFATTENLYGSGTTTLTSTRAKFQNIGNETQSALALYRTTRDTVPASLYLNKSYANNPNALSSVSIGDRLGKISFSGYEGSNYVEGATIDTVVTGSVASNSVPTDIRFNTYSSNLNTLSEAVRITKDQKVGIGTFEPLEKLTISGNVSASGTISSIGAISSKSNITATGSLSTSSSITSIGDITVFGNASAPNVAFGANNLVNGTVGDSRYDRIPGYRYEFFEHFLHTSTLAGGLTAIGGTNGGNVTTVTPTPASTLGVARMATGTAALTLCGGIITIPSQAASILFGIGSIKYVSRISRSTATWFDGTLTGVLRFGLCDKINTNPQYGIFFRVSNGSAVEFVTRNNDVETTTATGINLVNGTYNTFQFDVNSDATSVVARIDGNIVATHTTNIPSAQRSSIVTQLTRASGVGTNVSLDIDFIYFSLTPTNSYFT